jgi:hypothetical protein
MNLFFQGLLELISLNSVHEMTDRNKLFVYIFRLLEKTAGSDITMTGFYFF